MFFIRGYAFYATEEELRPIMKKFQELLEKNHDYIDYEPILSVAGLPYLVEKYGFDCFSDALKTAKNEYQKINPRLRNHFTLNEKLEQDFKLSPEEAKKQFNEILRKAKI